MVRGGADRENKDQVKVSRLHPPGARRQAWKCLNQGTEVINLEREASGRHGAPRSSSGAVSTNWRSNWTGLRGEGRDGARGSWETGKLRTASGSLASGTRCTTPFSEKGKQNNNWVWRKRYSYPGQALEPANYGSWSLWAPEPALHSKRSHGGETPSPQHWGAAPRGMAGDSPLGHRGPAEPKRINDSFFTVYFKSLFKNWRLTTFSLNQHDTVIRTQDPKSTIWSLIFLAPPLNEMQFQIHYIEAHVISMVIGNELLWYSN